MAKHNQNSAYSLAKERYQALGVDTEKALARLGTIPISLHCWQGDDVGGFESMGESLGGGLAVTGHYPGKRARRSEFAGGPRRSLLAVPGNIV